MILIDTFVYQIYRIYIINMLLTFMIKLYSLPITPACCC